MVTRSTIIEVSGLTPIVAIWACMYEGWIKVKRG